MDLTIPDPQTQVNALINGEVDLVEIVPPDLLPLLAKEKNIKITVVNKAGRQYAMRFNVLHKPFDNAKVRQAVLYGLSQKEFLEANVGNPEYYKECKSVFPCGSPLESTKGWDDKLSRQRRQGQGDCWPRRAMTARRWCLLHQTDTSGHNNLATVAKAQLEKSGLKVDLQPMDWQTLVTRRTKKEAPDKGGWGAYFTSWGATDVLNPVSAAFLNASCDKATFGWPCDETLEKLRDAYASEIRSGQAEGDRRAGPAARAGLSDVCAARPVHDADRDPHQHRRSAEHAVAGAVEHREEVMRATGRTAAAFLTALGLAFGAPASAESVLRVSMHSDLKIIDPIWTTALISADHGIWSTTRCSRSTRSSPSSRRWSTSGRSRADKLTWTFTCATGWNGTTARR